LTLHDSTLVSWAACPPLIEALGRLLIFLCCSVDVDVNTDTSTSKAVPPRARSRSRGREEWARACTRTSPSVAQSSHIQIP
jgi:hypothetical protein